MNLEGYFAREEWIEATFRHCLAGDRIRIGQQEATVLSTTGVGRWHARNREWTDDAGKVRDHQTPWEHEELTMSLKVGDQVRPSRQYPPDTDCEILCTPERAAALLLAGSFPGTKPVDG